MTTDTNYYCYVYKREDGTPYYIGKGKGSRAFISSGRIISPPRDRTNIFFACEGVTESEAFEMEVALISLLGRKDLGTGILRNKTDGGEGVSGWVPSEETKRKMSEKAIGRVPTEQARKRMSEARKGQKVSEETKRRVGEASKGRIHSEEARQKMSEAKKGKYPGESNPNSKLTDVQRLEIVQRRKNGESTLKLATEFGVSRRTICKYCKPQ